MFHADQYAYLAITFGYCKSTKLQFVVAQPICDGFPQNFAVKILIMYTKYLHDKWCLKLSTQEVDFQDPNLNDWQANQWQL